MAKDTLSLLRSGKLGGTTRLDLSCGLTDFPPEIFDLADSLEILNLSGNRLSDLPDDLPRLRRLRVLFCSENDFRHVPEVLGECPGLSMTGFKSNRIEALSGSALPPALRWLILTDNRLKQLPASLGNCTGLQKLMLSGNLLERLPEEMAACVNLELIRLAANRFRALPDWLFTLPRLAWLAFAGNPCSAGAPPAGGRSIREIPWVELRVQEKLGEGASGVISKALWLEGDKTRPVAVKIFKGAVTSDGLPASEMEACLAAGRHPNLTETLGRLAGHPADAAGLVMALIPPDFKNLAGPPDLHTCTRDIYPDDARFSLPVLLRMVSGLASAARQLHDRGILHGDFYAHNVLCNAEGDGLLGDFGAASFYPADGGFSSQALQRVEVRAFGCLLEELLTRCAPEADERQQNVLEELRKLQAHCHSEISQARPLFTEIDQELRRLSAALPSFG